jgi:hypothetical protein
VKSRVDFEYRMDGAGCVSVMANAWVEDSNKEVALGPWYSEEYDKKRVALEDIVLTLLEEIVSGHLRFQTAAKGGYFERGPKPEEEPKPKEPRPEEQDRVLGQTLRQVYALMDENTRLDEQLQEALKFKEQAEGHEETKRLLREAYARIERLSGRLAQVQAIAEKSA